MNVRVIICTLPQIYLIMPLNDKIKLIILYRVINDKLCQTLINFDYQCTY